MNQTFSKRIYCAQVSQPGSSVFIVGWVSRTRDHGNVIFVDVRDRSGIVQVVFDHTIDSEQYQLAKTLRSEYVIGVSGLVVARQESTINSKTATGMVEIHARELKIYNASKTLPFSLSDSHEIDEEIRLEYRYLDLRRDVMHKRLALRHDIIFTIRSFFHEKLFYEIETPILTKNTPEGAREFIVPFRGKVGNCFSLPQSPQLYKQLLMAGGMERYFQIARCFRDEDLRADRQPEFTQLDVEMSFIQQQDIQNLIEELMQLLFKKYLNIDLVLPLQRMTYDYAFSTYGSDKPDIRFDMPIGNVTSAFSHIKADVIVRAFANKAEAGALCINDYKFTRSELDDLTSWVLKSGAKGLVWIRKAVDGSYESPLAKYFPENFDQLLAGCGYSLVEGQTLFVIIGEYVQTWNYLGRLRLHLAEKLSLIPKNVYKLLWITDFPMFEYDQETKKWNAVHHPFTRPTADWHTKTPAQMTAVAYDMVLNGVELGGGSMRIYERDLQEKMFEILGLDRELMDKKFGFLLRAQEFGFPPHGGIAFGIDRIVMLFLGCNSIREVIAFPKTARGYDPLMQSPTEISDDFLKDYGLKKMLINQKP